MMDVLPLPAGFFEQSPAACARALLGCLFEWDGCSGWVVEAEAYSEKDDAACHTVFRPSARSFVDAQPPGAAYVYFNYGVHWMTNVLVRDRATGERGFVLLRALEPCEGLDTMRQRRGRDSERELCSGPGKLSQALGITGEHHGMSFSLAGGRGFLPKGRREPPGVLAAGPRIGISRAVELPWRFYLAGNPHVSVGTKSPRPKP